MNKSLIIKQIIAHYNFKKDADFADFLGIAPTTLSSWQSRNTFDIELLHAKCVDINSDWLLTGKGKMLRKENNPLAILTPINKGIPLIPVDAIGGYGSDIEYQIKDGDIEERYIVPDFDRVKPDYLIRVKGSSMSPKYNSGDIIAIKKIPLNSFIQWNKPHVIDTTEQGVLVKRIDKSEKNDHFLLISDNEKYKPFEVHISKVRSLCLVVGVIRLE